MGRALMPEAKNARDSELPMLPTSFFLQLNYLLPENSEATKKPAAVLLRVWKASQSPYSITAPSPARKRQSR